LVQPPAGPRASPWSGAWADAPRGQGSGSELQSTAYSLRSARPARSTTDRCPYATRVNQHEFGCGHRPR
jgi:hypothetical protein